MNPSTVAQTTNHHDISEFLSVQGSDLSTLPQGIQDSLNNLKKCMDILEINDISFSSYSDAINRMSADLLSLRRTANRLSLAENELQDNIAWAQHELTQIIKWRETIQLEQAATESASTISLRRDKLLKKAKEYHKELIALQDEMPAEATITITQLMKQQERNKAREQELKAKRAKLKAFQGLPPNLELAKHELRNARSEQMALIQLRERLLRKMAESVS